MISLRIYGHVDSNQQQPQAAFAHDGDCWIMGRDENGNEAVLHLSPEQRDQIIDALTKAKAKQEG